MWTHVLNYPFILLSAIAHSHLVMRRAHEISAYRVLEKICIKLRAPDNPQTTRNIKKFWITYECPVLRSLMDRKTVVRTPRRKPQAAWTTQTTYPTDKPKALKRDCITILICCSRKMGFRQLFTFTIKALTYTDVPARLAHFTHTASIFWNRKTQRSFIRGRGTSILTTVLRLYH